MWKQHPIYSNIEASICGRIRNKTTGTVLKPEINERGYLRIATRIDGKRKNLKVHRLVAETYIENMYNYPDVDHLSRDKQDNSVGNLEWVSRKENVQRYFKIKKTTV